MKQACCKYFSVLFTGVVVVLSSCLNPQPRASRLLHRAEALMEDHPDSAMLLIDSIFYPEASFREPQYMRYLVTRVRARYKNHRPVHEDTLIFTARDYFTRHDKDPRRPALAWFYSGCVHREREEYGKAMQQYKTAEEYSAKTGDADLRGLVQYNMGDLLAEEGLHAEALEQYRTAETRYRQSPVNPEEKQARCLGAIGRMFLLAGEQDSAFAAFHKGLQLAETSGNGELQSLLAQNLSVGYKESGQYAEAEKYLHQSFILNNDTSELLRYYLNFAELYAQMGKTDSVILFSQKLKNSMDSLSSSPLKASILSYLAEQEKANGNYDAAFDYQADYTREIEKIANARLQQSGYEVQKKYDYEVIKNQYAQQLSLQQQWLIALLIVLLSGGTFFTVYTIRQKNILLKTRDNIDTLRQMAADLVKSHESDLQRKESHLRELLLWKFDIVKKSALLNAGEIDHKNASQLVKKFHAIVYGGNAADRWESILTVFDQVNKGLSYRIKYRFPQLGETEYRICLLSYAGMSVKEIAIILRISSNTVQTYRTGLRKKLGIDNPATDISLFLKNTMNI